MNDSLKKGQRVSVRLQGSEHWTHGTVSIASGNGKSIGLRMEDDMEWKSGFAIDTGDGKKVLLLSLNNNLDSGEDLFSGSRYDIKAIQ